MKMSGNSNKCRFRYKPWTRFYRNQLGEKKICLTLEQDARIFEFDAYGMTGQYVQEAPIGKN